MAEHIVFTEGGGKGPNAGSAGLRSQLPGMAATVSAAAQATGGIRPGGFVEPANEKMRTG